MCMKSCAFIKWAQCCISGPKLGRWVISVVSGKPKCPHPRDSRNPLIKLLKKWFYYLSSSLVRIGILECCDLSGCKKVLLSIHSLEGEFSSIWPSSKAGPFLYFIGFHVTNNIDARCTGENHPHNSQWYLNSECIWRSTSSSSLLMIQS